MTSRVEVWSGTKRVLPSFVWRMVRMPSLGWSRSGPRRRNGAQVVGQPQVDYLNIDQEICPPNCPPTFVLKVPGLRPAAGCKFLRRFGRGRKDSNLRRAVSDAIGHVPASAKH